MASVVDVSTIVSGNPHNERLLHLGRLLEELAASGSHMQADQITERLDALDKLDSLVGDLDAESLSHRNHRLMAQAEDLKTKYETANRVLYRDARTEITAHGRSTLLACWLRETNDSERVTAPRAGLSFDVLDEIAAGVLELSGSTTGNQLQSLEMTDYQPTPVRHILALIAACKLSNEDVLVDLGSGMGHVPLLVSLLTGIRTVGVEVQRGHALAAQQAAKCLNLTNVRFLSEDARLTNLGEGTVFTCLRRSPVLFWKMSCNGSSGKA